MKSSHTLRAAIREILMENYNVSITAVPISTGEKLKRGQKPPPDKMANVILSAEDLDELIGAANLKDALQGYTEEDEEIKRRIDIIEKRVSPGAAKMARAIVKQMSEDDITSTFYNMPAEKGNPDEPAGAVTIEHPRIVSGNPTEYEVPRALHTLALFDKPGARGTSIGKGEVLAFLMFGRDSDAGPEPDLVVGGDGYSVKYFERPSSTVFPGADLDKGPEIREIVDVSEEIKKIAQMKGFADGEGSSISRNQIRTMLSRLDADLEGKSPGQIYVSSGATRADQDPTGIADEDVNYARSTSEVRRLATRCAELWDTLPLSGHDVVAIVGKTNMKVYAVPRDMALPGLISRQGLQIASPMAAAIPVTPGAGAGAEDEEF